jgi:hypothetical protein
MIRIITMITTTERSLARTNSGLPLRWKCFGCRKRDHRDHFCEEIIEIACGRYFVRGIALSRLILERNKFLKIEREIPNQDRQA